MHTSWLCIPLWAHASKLKHTLRQKSLEFNIKETTSNVNGHFKSSAVPLYYSLSTSQTHAYRLSVFNINKLLGFLYDTLTISRLCEEGIVRIEDLLGEVFEPLPPDPWPHPGLSHELDAQPILEEVNREIRDTLTRSCEDFLCIQMQVICCMIMVTVLKI